MKQKRILSIAILSLLSLAVFVSASMIVDEEYSDSIIYTTKIDVVEGWNLVSGISDVRDIKENSEVKKKILKLFGIILQ